MLCVKGKFGYKFIDHPDRLKTPLIKRNGKFEEATWDEAYEIIATNFNRIKSKNGSESLAGLASARVTNEENYLFQKMVRVVFGTNNVDHCARLCHASTVAGLATTLGSGAMTNSIGEIVDSDVIFVSGSNTTEAHPVIGAKIRQAVQRGAKLIVAEPRKIDLVEDSVLFLQIKPGTNVALYNGMMNVIINENLVNKKFIDERSEGYQELVDVIKNYTPDVVAKICEVSAVDIIKAARLYAKADKASIFYSMGVTQHSTGTSGVMSISNLAVICGHIGRESTGVNPLRGQNNVQGACDMGCLPGDLTGYQKVFNKETLEKFEKSWNVKLSDKPGLTVTEILNEAGKENIKFLYIMGENPMVSDPDINHVKEALLKLEFLVVQDIFMTETAELADVVLPATTFAEKEGTFTNTERRVQRIRKAINPIGSSKPDWLIITELMNKLGFTCSYKNPSEIMDEVSTLTPIYAGISYDRINLKGLQWPCPDKNHPGTKFLHAEKFSRGKALLKPAEYIKSAELPDADYPFILTTGRNLYQYHTRTMSGKVDGLNEIAGESYIELNPEDAYKMNIQNDEIVVVSSRRGSVSVKARVTDVVSDGVVFMPFHYAEGAANYLTNNVIDPTAKIPEFKVCAVNIKKQ
jgi:formate dehydrogenase major subunit